ncbi:MAG: hypothetical protein ACKO4L_02630 [Nodosilinea sp.]
MLRPDPAQRRPRPGSSPPSSTADGDPGLPTIGDIDIQQALNKLEEIILASPRVPFTGRTLIDEDQLLDQLDAIRLNLPPAFRQAVQVLQQRQDLIADAEQYVENLLATAERQSAQILDELGILRQAEEMAQQLKAQTQADCDQLRNQVTAELQRLQQQAQQEWQIQHQNALAEQSMIQEEADAYVDRVLSQVEQQLSQMLRIIQNGRNQLQPGAASPIQPSPPGQSEPQPRRTRPQPSP